MGVYSKIEKYLLLGFDFAKLKFKGRIIETGNVFHLNQPDFKTSPHTGMTRIHWLDAATYLLKGVFMHIPSYQSPVIFPKQPGAGYPARPWHRHKRVNENLEGVCRTLFVAAPLLKENPGLELNGLRVQEFYLTKISQLVAPGGMYQIEVRGDNPHPRQPLVELGALAIILSLVPKILWDPLAPDVKTRLSELMLSYGDGPTVPNNWRFFNIFILSFLKKQGQIINETLLSELLEASLGNYAGDGWYSDNPAFDYYSMWGFQTYSALWAELYGDQHPHIAAAYKANFKEMLGFYPHLFGKDGKMPMWGRSISYRSAAVAPFPFAGLLDSCSGEDLGRYRRIASGCLLQFLKHPDFLKGGVPTLGFYEGFAPAVQPYNCRGSVYWFGKAFLGLFLEADNPYWTALEQDNTGSGTSGNLDNRFAEQAGILVSRHPDTGISEIRANVDQAQNTSKNIYLSDANYNRLAYNSEFPWQADDTSDGTAAMNYTIWDGTAWKPLNDFKFLNFEEGWYRRTAAFAKGTLELAEKVLPDGILRQDVVQASTDLAITLGHYALPELEHPLQSGVFEYQGQSLYYLDNGRYKLGVIALEGWDQTEIRIKTDLHPEAKRSGVMVLTKNYSGKPKSIVLQTLLIWSESKDDWPLELLKY